MSAEDRRERRRSFLRAVLEVPIILLLSFALVFGFVRPVVAAPYRIPTESMVPTLMVQDRLLVNKLAYDLASPKRGDVVLFENQEGGPDPLIKRVVAAPGDTVEIRRGKLLVNDRRPDEPYVRRDPCKPGLPKTCSYGPVEVPEGRFFMMGDNRTNSKDSRFFGPVPEGDVIGEALFRFWPPGRVAAGGALHASP